MAQYDKAWVNEKTGEIHSPRGRIVYTQSILEAKINTHLPPGPTNKPKHNTLLLIPKGADISAISADIARAAQEMHGKDWKTKKKLEYPLVKTVDFEKLREYAETFPLVLKVASNEGFPPFVFGPDAKHFSGSPSEIYSGRWATITGSAWPWKPPFANGIGWNFSRIQLLEHDEPIAGGRVATSEGFEQVNIAATADDVFGKDPAPAQGKKADLDDEIPF